jgi:hypothetical protein
MVEVKKMKIKRIIRIIRVIFHDVISNIVHYAEEEEKEHKNEKILIHQ